MRRILSTAATEARIAARNRWVAISIGLMALFSLVLAAAGSAPTGALGTDRLSVIVASLTSLAVYLVPLLALLMSFDAVAGEEALVGFRGWLRLELGFDDAEHVLEMRMDVEAAHHRVGVLAGAVGENELAAGQGF